ncbi:glycoside hydrolase family 16 protein [Polaribacter sp. WD7]|uniref:glycoside hydrolase family 16 protein n=1 Tax=Polaribacter sp. WD7 TaxID=2269061 RepID=UPI000DF34F32|nr:glycoside hydrolase family 16 protein [Polaribacter sp. WD7]RCS27316.1 glycoside hydrolase family 16 protein [Polaribacter sp. WD7]
MKNIFNYKIYIKTFIFASVLILVSCETDTTQTVTTLNNLIWQDEFDVNGAVDTTKWVFDLGDGSEQGIPGWGNNELQYYTNRPENIIVEDGALVITANQEAFMGSSYTSARINTRGLFEQQHGRFEARIQLPTGKGIWPAFWLLGDDEGGTLQWPQIGEIDIMEYLGNQPTIVFGTVHGPGYSGGESISKEYQLQNDRFDNGFHVFGIEWSPNRINYYVDGDLYQSITPETVEDETNGQGEWVFNRPFYIILNVAVGGNLPGSPNDETLFPQKMLVDYVRVYQ